jgi:hypothetical protein
MYFNFFLLLSFQILKGKLATKIVRNWAVIFHIRVYFAVKKILVVVENV